MAVIPTPPASRMAPSVTNTGMFSGVWLADIATALPPAGWVRVREERFFFALPNNEVALPGLKPGAGDNSNCKKSLGFSGVFFRFFADTPALEALFSAVDLTSAVTSSVGSDLGAFLDLSFFESVFDIAGCGSGCLGGTASEVLAELDLGDRLGAGGVEGGEAGWLFLGLSAELID